MDTGLNSYEHEVYKHKRKKLGIFNSSCSVGSQYGDGGDPNVETCPDFTGPVKPSDPIIPGVRIRYTSSDDLTVYNVVAIGGTAYMEDNGDGTYDLWSDDDCEFVSFYDSYDVYYSYVDNLNVTKVEVIKGSSLKYFIDLSLDVSTFGNLRFTEFVWSDSKCTPTSTSYMFNYCSSLLSLDVTFLDMANVTTAGYMFSGCSSLTSLDVSSFNTGNVVDMEGMLSDCELLESLDLTSFDTSNATTMSFMFFECESLICITNVDTTNATVKTSMFNGCTALVQPDAAAQADLIDSNGADWLNPNSCP